MIILLGKTFCVKACGSKFRVQIKKLHLNVSTNFAGHDLTARWEVFAQVRRRVGDDVERSALAVEILSTQDVGNGKAARN
ncbi:hypothetical protein RvVAT039_pl07280 (plasmid) [Agrobacterium vitis]|nr:hypothetical protein RvVAT039_pl07280 [Agrobacterium vitis]